MSKHTSFKVGGPARYYVKPMTGEEIAEILATDEEIQVEDMDVSLLSDSAEEDGKAMLAEVKLKSAETLKSLQVMILILFMVLPLMNL